ncbi:MAG: cbb3-type cytochrome c oxidase subunit 3 [Hyphomicrobium sp.]
MTYETVAAFSQVTSLLMFIAMFAAVLVYALRPKNRLKFERASRSAIESDAALASSNSGVRHD